MRNPDDVNTFLQAKDFLERALGYAARASTTTVTSTRASYNGSDAGNGSNTINGVGSASANNAAAAAAVQRFLCIAEALGLEDRLVSQSLMSDLSGGELSRAVLACGIALAPDVLLLDEPTSALDHKATAAAEQQLKHAADQLGMIVVVVSHSPEQIARIADTVLAITMTL